MIILQAWKQLVREWRSGELYVLFFSIVIAVAAVSSVSFFTDRVQRALGSQANELLGADLVLNGSNEFDADYFEQAEQLGLSVVKQVTFPSMVMSDNGSHLAWMKVVEQGFPLRGQLGISDGLFKPEVKTNEIPAAGQVWIEPRLLSALKLNINDTLHIGALALRVTALVTSEPGRGGDMFNIAPRVLLNYQDLVATQLIQAGSRVRYTLLIAGDERAVATFQTFVREQNAFGVSMQDVRDARPEVKVALSRAEQFLGLAALTSVILAGIAIALAAKRFAQRHLDHCAILRCVGATQSYILKIYLWQIVFIGLLASLTGAAVGYFAHELLINMLGSLVGVNLPGAGFSPVIFAMATGLVTLAGFALPPIIALKNVPALRVIKRDLGNINASRILSYGLGIGALSFIMIMQAGDIKLGIYMVAGAIGAVVVLIACAYLLLFMVRQYRPKVSSPWYIGLRNLVRRSNSSIIQIVAFGLGIMALLILAIIRGDLLDEWQASIPSDAPNRFVINISPDQVPAMRVFFQENVSKVPELYPMIRGRIIAINEREITSDSYEDQHAKQMLSREFNLSWAEALATSNTIVEGEWWQAKQFDAPLASIEKSVAENLKIKIGDNLRVKVAEQIFTAKVASIRDVDWGSFGANFYVLTTPGLMRDMPTTYMTPFFLADDQYEVLNKMVERFNNVTVIDVAAVMSQVRMIINRVTLAVEYVFMFTLLAGVMVLFAGIQSTLDERMVENAIMKTVGGKKKQLLQALWAEYLCLGALSGLIAALLATIVSWVIAHFILKMPMPLNFSIWIYGMLGGAIGVSIFGVLGSAAAIKQPPMQILKKISLS